MVSFTGSTRAGIQVAKNAADTVKRVCQELGGKSANILLDDADFQKAVTRDVLALLQQQRSIVQRAVAHAGSGRSHGRGQPASRAKLQRWYVQATRNRRGDDAGAGGEPSAA
jgi:hypothetical protein